MEKTRKSVIQTSTKETARPYGAGRFLFNGLSSANRIQRSCSDVSLESFNFLLFATVRRSLSPHLQTTS
jgi:hypothetical protein